LTLRCLPLRFTQEVRPCQEFSIIQQFDFPSQARHFFTSQPRVALPA